MKALLLVLLFIKSSYCYTRCGPDEYPSRLQMGLYGEVSFGCTKSPCLLHSVKCEETYYQLTCKGPDSWVGGIGGESNANKMIPMQCCTVEGLRKAKPQAARIMRPGDVFEAELHHDFNGNPKSYDVITNIERVRLGRGERSNGIKVSLSRFQCHPKQAQFQLSQPEASSFVADQSSLIQAPSDFSGYNDGPYQFDGQGDGFGQAQQLGGPFGNQGLGQGIGQGLGPGLGQGPGLGGLGALGAAGAGAGACFHGDGVVETPTGPKLMKELRVGDRVLAIDAGITGFSTVRSFIHRVEDKETEFRRIVTEDGNQLDITPFHFIYTTPCSGPNRDQAIKAGDVKVGDCLVRVDSDGAKRHKVRVTSNTGHRLTGIYAPLTDASNIVVNNYHASCHSVHEDQSLMNSFMKLAEYLREGTKLTFGTPSADNKEEVELHWILEWGLACVDHLVLGLK